MKIGIIGNGVVGSATAAAFRQDHEVRVFDVLPERRTTDSILHTIASDIVFVCLPTPQMVGSLDCDTNTVESLFAVLAGDNLRRNFVLRSTVPIGFTRKMREKYELVNLVHSPEFLTARTAIEDAVNPTRLIIGYQPDEYAGSTLCAKNLTNLYFTRWPEVRIHLMTSDESEAVKLFQNAHSAIKVAAFNEFRSLADVKGLGWRRVLTALLAGGWINEMHTQVPGPDGKRGFGGTCLPKDLANLISCLRDAGLEDNVSFAAHTRNKKDRLA